MIAISLLNVELVSETPCQAHASSAAVFDRELVTDPAIG